MNINYEGCVLVHHGVLGMKWGQHRFKDEHGNITARGNKVMNRIERSKIRSAIQTHKARVLLSRNFHNADKMAKINVEAYRKNDKKSTEYYNKAREAARISKNSKEYEKQYNKYIDSRLAANRHLEAAKQYVERSKTLTQKIKDIDSGKVKAGRDFVVQTDYNVVPFVVPGAVAVSTRRERQIIYR